MNVTLSKPLILVADDDKMTHTLLRVALDRAGFSMIEAFDGQTAITKAHDERPDLILMDVQMPILDGFQAVKLLREDPMTHRIPIIVLTAAARDPLDVARGLNLGADDYLRKPFNLDELIARVSTKIRARQLEERLQQRTNELEALVQIGAQLNEALALDDLTDRLLGIMLMHIPSACATLALVNPAGALPLIRLRCPDQADQDQNGRLANATLPMSSTLLAHVLNSGEPLWIDQLPATMPTGQITAILDGSGCQSGIAAPLIHGGQTLGVVLLGDDHAGRFTDGDLRVLRSISEQAALAIRNAQLYAELQGYAQGLETMVATRTAALQSAQAQLVRAEKLAAIGTLAAGIAHEVNNPLQPVLMCLEMSLESIDEGRLVEREPLEIALKEVQRIKRIVSGLLEFARPDRRGMTSVDMNEIVEEVLSLARKQLEYKRIKVTAELTSLPLILGSIDQLKQVVLNLVVNAMDAMPDGGTVQLHSFLEGTHVGLSVVDNGPGMPPEIMAKVFDPFFTTKAEGTGLGLAVSYGIIEGHGGEFEVNSTLGAGSAFTIRLPMIPDTEGDDGG